MSMIQTNIGFKTPMGAALIGPSGATFKLWAPAAQAVYLNGTFGGANRWSSDTDASLLMQKDANGYWTGFLGGTADGDEYKYYVVGPVGGNSGYKRDPYAREFTHANAFPNVNCIIRGTDYPWHANNFATPDFSNMIIYQLHIGTYAPSAFPLCGTFLDVVEKIEYLAALGINVLQPLPIVEFEERSSLGYDGTDYFSPEMLYGVYDPVKLGLHLQTINRLLSNKGCGPVVQTDIDNGCKQLKTLVDLCHLYGIAVTLDVVYNHAGGFMGDDESIYFLDREPATTNNNSLYFSDQGWAGGLSFALWKSQVRQFLIDNATFYLNEYRVDGFRYDEISALIQNNQTTGWGFCQNLTDTLRFVHDRVLQNAEHWPVDPWIIKPSSQGGAGFDVIQHDGLRLAIRNAIAAASGGQDSAVSLDNIAANLYPNNFPQAWMAVPCVENHDLVLLGRDQRIPRLADGSNSRSFYARSRSKVATGLLLAAPGIPHLFMGQEFLEDKQWDTNPGGANLLYWAGLNSGDKSMSDQLRFTQDFIRLRWLQPALRGQSLNTFHVNNVNRIIAFHRWIEGQGRDVVVVASLNDSPFFNYQLGFPRGGSWAELFNSDVYDNWVNPLTVGNSGGVYANGEGLHGLPCSARITIPPRAILVFGIN
jgi:1,4-alpha-glucan branching enzyme